MILQESQFHSEFSRVEPCFYVSSNPEHHLPGHNHHKVESKQCTFPMCVVVHFPERLHPECCLQFQSSAECFYLQGLKKQQKPHQYIYFS